MKMDLAKIKLHSITLKKTDSPAVFYLYFQIYVFIFYSLKKLQDCPFF